MMKINELIDRFNALPKEVKLIGTGGVALASGLVYSNIDELKSLVERGVEMFSPQDLIILKQLSGVLLMGVLLFASARDSRMILPSLLCVLFCMSSLK